MVYNKSFKLESRHRAVSFHDVTDQVKAIAAESGIMNAADPLAMIDEMIAATRRAADDLKKMEG